MKSSRPCPKSRSEVAQSLNPRGTVNFEYTCRRDSADQPLHHHLRLDANGCSIRYSKFPYPINNVRGQLEMIDHSWWFRNLQGMNDSAQIAGRRRSHALAPGKQVHLEHRREKRAPRQGTPRRH